MIPSISVNSSITTTPFLGLKENILGPGRVPPAGIDDVQLVTADCHLLPTPSGDLDLTGCLAVRLLPGGRVLAIMPLLFGQARLCLGRPQVMVEDGAWGGWDDVWDYPSLLSAALAMALWDPEQDAEPDGWHRHPRTGRRRPGGAKEAECVRM